MTRQYDNYGRDQLNIENFHHTPLITGQELLTRGTQLLRQRNYQQAISVLSDAIKTDPLLSDTHYYLAIALLSGKKPRKVDEWTIQDIEKQLGTAVREDTKPSRCYVLWAIVKHGFYTMNGFIDKPPTAAQFLSLGESIQAEDAKEILYHLNDPSNPCWLKLYNQFEKAH
jgi:tetratricopeptide (TPR) repeat protein